MIRANAGLGALAFTLVALPSIASAQSVERLSADVSATAAYSNNPFSVAGTDTGSPLLTLDFSPRFQILTQRSTITVSANANLQQYLRRYGRNDSYSGAVDYVLRPSERITARARLDLSSSVLGAFNGYRPAVGTADGSALPGATTPATPFVPVTDIGLFGLRSRQNLARLSGDISFGLSSRDSLTASGYAEAARYNTVPQFGDYDAYSASLGYTRQVSDRISIGLRASASSFNYKSPNSNSRVFPIEVTISGRLSERWSVDGAIGATFVDNNAVGSTSKTSLSGNVNLCRRSDLSSLCIQAARQASPTGLVGTQYVTSAGLNWTTRLSEKANLSFSGNYSKVGTDSVRLLPGNIPLQNEFAQAVASYDRRISERLRLIVSASYRALLNANAGRPKDFGGQIGISYRLGDTR